MNVNKASENELISSLTAGSTYAHFFTIGEGNARCKMCLLRFDYHQQKSGTNSLKRHLMNKHPKAYLAKTKSKCPAAGPSQSTLLQSGFQRTETKAISRAPISAEQCILTLVCSRHLLPLQFFEDPVVSRGFCLPQISRQDVHNEIRTLCEELREIVFETNRGKWATLALDGWKNPQTGNHHLTLMMFVSGNAALPIFLHSFVVESATAAEIAQCINVVLDKLSHYSITAVAVISDNAAAMLAATNQIFTQHATVLPLRCAVQVMNLIIKDFFKCVEFVKNRLDILEEYQ